VLVEVSPACQAFYVRRPARIRPFGVSPFAPSPWCSDRGTAIGGRATIAGSGDGRVLDSREYMPQTFLLEGFYISATPPATRVVYGSAMRCYTVSSTRETQISRSRYGANRADLGGDIIVPGIFVYTAVKMPEN